MKTNLILNRFRVNSVAGRMLKFLSNGEPQTPAAVARVAKPRSVENIMQPGGWFTLLRAYGKTSRKFTMEKTEEGKIVMRLRKGVRLAA